MCGIVGYVGYREARPILLDSLKRMEYRGYDSCGIAISADSELELHKGVGRVVDFEQTIPEIQGTIGIGHTRWATHGEVTADNAHPHTDCDGKIAVVHNGVIENFQGLREQLTNDGHRFNSDTDTEVIAHLIEKYYRGNLKEAVSEALKEVAGTYAIVATAEGCRELVAARKESPLVIGIGDKENFVASDVAAILDYTDRAIYLEDDDLAIVTENDIAITSNGEPLQREVQIVPWTVDEAKKAGYEHFMLKEIHEQPRAIEKTLRGRISSIEPMTQLGIEEAGQLEKLLLLACGTSYHAALIGEYVIGRLCHIPVNSKISSEFHHVEMALDRTWAMGISQSGETADTLGALKKAKALGCPTLGITNVRGSTITRLVDEVLYTESGPEIGVAATKTFLTQLATLYLFALSHASLDQQAFESFTEEFRLLPASIQQVLDSESEIASQGRALARYDNAFFIGRGVSFPVAMEGALKLKEISYIHAEAYPGGEIKHGPFALLRSNTPVVAVTAPDDTYEPMLTSIKEIKARGPQVLAVAEREDDIIEQYVDTVIRVPKVDPLFSPFVNTVALQLLAYYAARERGCPIDLPANLAKSVTVP
ncbi:MAG: glutamine--fructose-6-phosphate transaminase (isomerizing) [Dehalococcoidia bacterium]